MGLIFIISSFPGKKLPPLFPFSDKIFHLLEYALLGFLLRKAINLSDFRYPAVLAIIIGILYGITDEIHQYFVPGRECDIFDLTFDAFGCILAQWKIFYKRR
jgi:VanZ family protein